MARTVRIDAAQTYTGQVRIAEWGGFGALASDIIANHLDSILHNDCVDNGLTTQEVRAELRDVSQIPVGAALSLDDYGNPTLTNAPAGVHQFTYAFFVDDVEQGEATASVAQGDPQGTGTVVATTSSVAAISGSTTIESTGVISVTTDDAVAALVGASAPTGQGVMAGTTADSVAALSGQSGVVSTAVMSATTAEGDSAIIGGGIVQENNKGLGRGPIRVRVTGMY